MKFKPRQIVTDAHGNYFAVDKVTEGALHFHSVATKQTYMLTLKTATLELVVVEGLVEA